MDITVFSINKYKSFYIQNGDIQRAKNPSSWVFDADNCEARLGTVRGIDGGLYQTSNEWNAKIDAKYVRRKYNDLH